MKKKSSLSSNSNLVLTGGEFFLGTIQVTFFIILLLITQTHNRIDKEARGTINIVVTYYNPSLRPQIEMSYSYSVSFL